MTQKQRGTGFLQKNMGLYGRRWLAIALIPALILALGFTTGSSGVKTALQKLYDDNNSYWAKFLPAVNPALKKDLKVDVAVIGGGYTGLSAAYHIKISNPKLKVAVFEAKRVGNGASGRNGALVLAQTYTEGGMVMGANRAYHKEIYDITIKSMQRLKKLTESTGINPEFALNGQCLGLYNEDNLESFKAYATEAAALGLPIEYWEREKAVEMLGSPGLKGAVYDPNGGTVNPAKLIAALKKLAEKSGVTIYENSPVLELTEGKNIELTVYANQKYWTVTAPKIVIAANAYAAQTLDFMVDEIEPAHTQVAVTAPLTETQFQQMGWKNQIAWYDDQYVGTDGDATFHMTMTKDRRIIIGGGSVEYNEDESLLYPGDLKSIRRQIEKRLSELYPSVKGIKIESVWDGIICETKSKTERLGVTGKYKNIYYALGYNGGQGVNVAFLFGELVAKLHNGEKHFLHKLFK